MIEELKNKRIAVLMGGFSAERDVSLSSGKQVLASLLNQGYNAIKFDPLETPIHNADFDLAFNVLHGEFGEDGTIQAILDSKGIPYTGSNAKASLMAMNKYVTKQILIQQNLPTPKYCVINNEKTLPNFNFPVVIKPLNQGSSVGVHIIKNETDYTHIVQDITNKYGICMVEEFISGQEVTVGLLDNGVEITHLPILELRSKKEFYDFEAKYTKGMTEFILPAELSDEQSQYCQNIAEQTHRSIGCSGATRVDMVVHPERGPFILEINTLPGLTPTSDLPAQAKAVGISFDELTSLILMSAITTTHVRT